MLARFIWTLRRFLGAKDRAAESRRQVKDAMMVGKARAKENAGGSGFQLERELRELERGK